MRVRTAKTSFKWIKAYDGELGNENADKLAKQGSKKLEADRIDYYIPDEFNLEGARLKTMTQKLAYEIIKERTDKPPMKYNARTRHNIENIQDEIERECGERPSTTNIWKGLYKDPLQNQISDFLWKYINERIRCGQYFRFIPNWEEKQYCTCGDIESPDHILLHCSESGIQELWEYIEYIWKKTTDRSAWVKPTAGIIGGINLMKVKDTKNGKQKSNQALTRRYKIMVSEAIWIVWKERNNRIFNEEPTDINRYIER